MTELILILQLPQDVSTRYRSVDMTVLAPEPPYLVQTPCAKTRDNMPVFALELGGLRPDLACGFW